MIHAGRIPGSLALVALLALAACGQQAGPAGTQLDSEVARMSVEPAAAAAVDDVVAAAESLGLDLIARGGDHTTVISPASLQVALSMAAEGAEGQTLRELESLVGAAGRDRSEAVNALTTTLRALEGDPAVVQDDELPGTPMLHRANRLVLDDSLTVHPAFVDSLARYYDAPAATTDLAGDEGKRVLDAWVDEHTGGLVQETAIEPGPHLRLVLQDALVLAARWDEPFPAALTSVEPFTLPVGEVVQVDMMDPGTFRETVYAGVEGWQAVRLPYSGQRLHADVILPPSETAPTELTPRLMDKLQQGLDAGRTRPVVLRMPVVQAESTLDLMPYLADRAPSALNGGFGGITDEPVFIEQAMQQGVLVVDEEGTLAAAVTEIAFAESGSAQPPLELIVDRPYLVRIADGRTGWPLILTHIADPRKEQ